MKTLILSIALIAAARLPARAHHETVYGFIWKAGYAASKPNSRVQAELWRYAFVSKYTWVGCSSTAGY